ncbi:hypothetical protein QBZ16_000939 [Prototheca wickerhamii]|uniref:DOT1 domain-containing protein n=1 Tax=Prototheca wickerhamii TaxID=3111 RepID=A0AAD9IDX5_PROWI|nr:hypothetical protein QBZ16_000939 [Prototheca wickerhamii]
MQSIENNLGGGEGIEGLYGSITRTGTQKILASMVEHCGLGSESSLVDVGAGLGRPLLHALVYPGVKATLGVELDEIKVQKARVFLKQSVQRVQRKGLLPEDLELPMMQCAAIEEVASLERCTHAYSFWEGVPIPAREAFGKLVARSDGVQGVAVIQRAMRDPEGAMLSLGFGQLSLRASFPVSMSGSGRSFTAYVFAREAPALRRAADSAVQGGLAAMRQTKPGAAAARAADKLGKPDRESRSARRALIMSADKTYTQQAADALNQAQHVAAETWEATKNKVSEVTGAAQNRAEETKNDATSHQSGVRGLVDDAKNKATELGNRASEKTTEAKHSAQESTNKAANIADEKARQ